MPWFISAGIFVVLVAILAPAVQQARNAARKSTSKNNLKQFGIALHNYHDTLKCFPPGGVINREGVAFHGWYTGMMPFLDASPYYSMIDFDYPWTDRENERIFRNKHPVALMPGVSEEFTSERYALLHYQANPHVFHRNSSIRLKDLESDDADVWLLGEVAGNYQPWGYPFNWRELGPELNSGPDSYGRPTEDGACFVMADGSVRFIQNEVSPEVLDSLANSQTAPPAEATKRPNRRFEYGGSTWSIESLTLEKNEDGQLVAEAHFDPAGNLHTVFLEPVFHDKEFRMPRAFTTDDLRRTAEKFPEMRALCNAPDIDDRAATILSVLLELEFLQSESVELSDRGIKALQKLPRLQILRAAMSEEMRQKLSAALKECDVQNTRRTEKVEQERLPE